MRRLIQRLRYWAGHKRAERELAEEMELHRAMRQEELERSGMPEKEAAQASRRAMGNVVAAHEDARAIWIWPWFEHPMQDLRYACRVLTRNPGFAIAVVLTLALAIGANTAIFSAVHGVLIRPLPYPDADRLVRIYTVQTEGGNRSASAIPDYLDWKQLATSFEAMEGIRQRELIMDGDPVLRIPVISGTPELLALIGARAALGRMIGDDDIRADAPQVVVLSHEFWTSRFGADPDVVGRSIRLGAARLVSSGGLLTEEIDFAVYTVIGVAAPIGGPLQRINRPLPGTVQAIVPWVIETEPRRDIRRIAILPIVARLRPGVSVAEAQAELDRIRADLREERPEARSPIPVAVSLHDATVAAARPALIALLGATGLILLIAVGNIANILLARGSVRQPELSMRSALGASRLRLARFLLTESVLLSLLGGIGGVVLGYAGIRALVSLEPVWIPGIEEIALDGTVLTAALGIAIASGLLFGLAPVLFLREVPMWKGGAGGGEPASGRGWFRNGLIVSQIALSFVLLAGSGLMIRSFLALRGVPIGFDPEQIVTFSLGRANILMGPSGPARVARVQQFREALEQVRAIPGVRGATLTSQAPLTRSAVGSSIEIISGLRRGETHSFVEMVGVTEDFFEFFRSTPIAGRLFESADASRAGSVVVVDADMAAIIWPDEAAVGQRVRFYDNESEVIGVVEPIRYGDLVQEKRGKLFHLIDHPGGGMFGSAALVRHDGESEPILAQIETRLNEVADDSLSPADLQPLRALYDGYLREPRFYVLLFGGLGFLGLAVAAVGVYGVIAYSVEQRTHEIGVRMALGAGRLQIAGLFCLRTMFLMGLGMGGGLLGAAWLSRYLESLLFEIEPADPVAWVSVATLLAATAVAATLVPIRRALSVDPAATLRHE